MKINILRFIFLHSLILFFFISCEKNTKDQSFLIQLTSTEQLYDLLKNEKYPLISSHRGGSAEGIPENSIQAFERAITFSPSMIETDIAMTKDSVLILMHDDKLDRTTTGKGFVNDFTYAEVQSFYLKDYKNNHTTYKIPTLEEALNWGKNKVVFSLDIKRGVPYEKVVEMVNKTNSQANSILITYNASQARALHKIDKSLWLSVSANSKADIERLIDYKVDVNRVVAFVGTTEPSKTTIDYMKSQNIPMILGTLGNLDKRAKAVGDRIYEEFFTKGITVLSADRNKEAAKVAEQYAQKNQLTSKYIIKQ